MVVPGSTKTHIDTHLIVNYMLMHVEGLLEGEGVGSCPYPCRNLNVWDQVPSQWRLKVRQTRMQGNGEGQRTGNWPCARKAYHKIKREDSLHPQVCGVEIWHGHRVRHSPDRKLHSSTFAQTWLLLLMNVWAIVAVGLGLPRFAVLRQVMEALGLRSVYICWLHSGADSALFFSFHVSLPQQAILLDECSCC